jgi:hypothetical protein
MELENDKKQETFEIKQTVPDEPKKDDSTADDTPRDLFGNPIKQESSAKKESATPKIHEKKYGTEYTVFFAGHEKRVPAEMTQEEIRQYLEEDFPELSKDRTSFDVNEEKKHLYVRVSGGKKG